MSEPAPVPVPAGNEIRAEMATVNQGSPRSVELEAQLEATYRAAHGAPLVAQPKPGAAPLAETAQAPPDGTAQRPGIFDDARPTPQTASEALAIPREFSETQRAQGWRRDDAQRAEAYAVAEREGLIPAARQFEGLIYELAGQPMPTGEETEDQLMRERGSRYDYEAARATEVWTLLERRLPALAANLTRTGLRYHPRTFDTLLALHTTLYDATTPHGERRLKAKYADRTGG